MLKLLFCILLSSTLILSLSACESRADRELRQAREAAANADANFERAKQEYEDLSQRINEINSLRDALND